MQYIKTPKELAIHLGFKYSRPQFPDGNYLLWDRDLLRFGNSSSFPQLIPALGCVILTPEEVRAEQDGGEPNELPVAIDERVVHLFEPLTQPAEKGDTNE